jgi:hypothetical protein
MAALRLCATLFGAAFLAGCGSGGVAGINSTPRTSLETALKLTDNCIQYQVSVDSAGVETWNADYVYFYMFKDGRPAVDERDQPVAQGLLYTQLKAFMAEHPQYPADTEFAYQVSRQVQRMKGGLVLDTSVPAVVPDADLEALLALAQK